MNNFRCFKRKDLKYQAAFRIQSQIISMLFFRGQRLFRASTGHYFTHHDGRNFMPTASTVLVSAGLTGTCWEAGRLKAANDIDDRRSTRLQ